MTPPTVTEAPLRLERVSSAIELLGALEAQHRLTQDVGGVLANYDLLVSPTLGHLPAPHGTLRYDDPPRSVTDWDNTLFDYGPFTAVFNITGRPALGVPQAHSESGLPIGVQLIAGHDGKCTPLRIAGQTEAALPWQDRTPELRPADAVDAARGPTPPVRQDDALGAGSGTSDAERSHRRAHLRAAGRKRLARAQRTRAAASSARRVRRPRDDLDEAPPHAICIASRCRSYGTAPVRRRTRQGQGRAPPRR